MSTWQFRCEERPAPVLQALPRGDVASVPLAGASICDPNWCSGRSLWTEKKYWHSQTNNFCIYFTPKFGTFVWPLIPWVFLKARWLRWVCLPSFGAVVSNEALRAHQDHQDGTLFQHGTVGTWAVGIFTLWTRKSSGVSLFLKAQSCGSKRQESAAQKKNNSDCVPVSISEILFMDLRKRGAIKSWVKSCYKLRGWFSISLVLWGIQVARTCAETADTWTSLKSERQLKPVDSAPARCHNWVLDFERLFTQYFIQVQIHDGAF